MSVYRCAICENLFDTDYQDCEAHRKTGECICVDCWMYSDPEFACCVCKKADRSVKYCKIKDQYFHEECL